MFSTLSGVRSNQLSYRPIEFPTSSVHDSVNDYYSEVVVLHHILCTPTQQTENYTFSTSNLKINFIQER